jgi:hypothetical protein
MPEQEDTMSAIIKIFQVGAKTYKHVMDASRDSVELQDETNTVLLVFGADARVRNNEGRLGDFFVEFLDGFPRWVFYDLPHQSRRVLSPDRHAAEVEVSRRYIGEIGAVMA